MGVPGTACDPVYGEPWSEPGVTKYAGCANWCKTPGCVSSETCGRAPGQPVVCFTFPDSEIPEGWILLSEVNLCGEYPECGKRP